MKKLISVVLALALVLSLSATAIAADDGNVVLHIQVPETWENCYVYNWTPDTLGSWPGTQATAEGDGWYTITVASGFGGMVVSAGEGKPQTIDIADLDFSYSEAWITVGDMVDGKHTYEISYEAPSAGGGNVIAEGTETFTDSNCYAGKSHMYTPDADGTVTIDITAADPGYMVSVYDTGAGELVAEFANSVAESVSFDVTGDVTYDIVVSSCTYYAATLKFASAGTVSYKITATVSGEGGGQGDAQDVTANDNMALVLGDNAVEMFDGDQAGATGTWTATEDGTLTVAVTAMSTFNAMAGMMEEIPAAYLPMQFGRGFALTVNGLNMYAPNATIQVSAGDVVTVNLLSYMGAATNATVNLAFEVASSGSSETVASNTVTLNSASDSEVEIVEFTASSNGTVVINMAASNPGWSYMVSVNGEPITPLKTGNTDKSVEYTVAAGDVVTIEFGCYDKAGWSQGDGEISYEVLFVSSDEDIDEEKEEYIVSDILLGLGENELTLDPNAITTIYEFCPDESGVYTFTANDGSALVGYWGAGSFFVWDQTENKTSILEYTLENAGPSIMIGISGVETVTLTIEKTGNVGGLEENEYIDYENVYFPTSEDLVDTTGEQINAVDITVAQTVVKDENGIYHLGTVDGPVLYVDLAAPGINFVDAFFGGYGALTMRGEYEGVKYDFLDAMRQYATVIYGSEYNNGLFPLTDDLVAYVNGFGSYQGWFMPGLSPFENIDGTENADSAWLAACVYLGEEYVEELPEDPENPGEDTPATGDFALTGLFFLMAVACVAVVVLCNKKKHF